MINKITKNNKGYTLLFAVLVASVVLAIGISILNISKKEFLLSASARESSSAFYAADSGLECAIFSEVNFSTTTQSASLDCMNQQFSVGNGITFTPDNNATGTFAFNLKMPNGSSCAVVTLIKYYQNDPVDGYIPRTTIESRGYNIGWDANAKTCTIPGPRRVERALRYTF